LALAPLPGHRIALRSDGTTYQKVARLVSLLLRAPLSRQHGVWGWQPCRLLPLIPRSGMRNPVTHPSPPRVASVSRARSIAPAGLGLPSHISASAFFVLVSRLIFYPSPIPIPIATLSANSPCPAVPPPAYRIPYSTPEAPHAGLPRSLHEVLSTAILISFAARPSTAEELAIASTSGGGGGGGSFMDFSLAGSLGGSMGGSMDDPAGGGGGGNGGAGTGISYGQTAQLVAWVMDRAEVLRRKVRRGGWNMVIRRDGEAGPCRVGGGPRVRKAAHRFRFRERSAGARRCALFTGHLMRGGKTTNM
jgi:hypothetical protein